MRDARVPFRRWLIPLALVAVAAALTVPWSYWVIQAAFDRDVMDNAQSLAHRVELRMLDTPREDEARDALRTELESDTTVQSAFYVDLAHYPPALDTVGFTRDSKTTQPPQWSDLQIRDLTQKDVTRSEDNDHYFIAIRWGSRSHVLGFTYLVLSRSDLEREFWNRDRSLLIRVVALSAAAIVVLSAVGWLAIHAWERAGRMQERAELARQGVLAERGLTAAVLAHEIRNPLAALRFQLHSLRKNAAEASRVAGMADTIDEELSRIQQLVSDYLEHEKARTMRVQSVDLFAAASSLRTVMGELLRETRTDLTIESVQRAPIHVVCDPHALRQVLMNLVLNAQQALRGVGHEGRISIRISQSEGFGAIDVADNGPGIAPEMRERLFKPFQTSKADGHGIGLALVKRFADNFGGSVSVDSELGRGTTFHLKLPLPGAAPKAPEPTASQRI